LLSKYLQNATKCYIIVCVKGRKSPIKKGKNKMNPMEFAEKIIGMPVEKQNEFFEVLRGELSEEDWKTAVSFISLFGMFKSPAKYEAMKNAVCDQLCEEFYGHTVEKQINADDAVLVSMYSNSIL
jgi:hypothetical protein